MTPENRFKLNEGAKEHRLTKLKGKLDAATPRRRTAPRTERRPVPEGSWTPWVFWIGAVVIGAWVLRKLTGH